MRGFEVTRETLRSQMREIKPCLFTNEVKLYLLHRVHVLEDLSCQLIHFTIGDIQNPVFNRKCLKLLFLEWNSKG